MAIKSSTPQTIYSKTQNTQQTMVESYHNPQNSSSSINPQYREQALDVIEIVKKLFIKILQTQPRLENTVIDNQISESNFQGHSIEHLRITILRDPTSLLQVVKINGVFIGNNSELSNIEVQFVYRTSPPEIQQKSVFVLCYILSTLNFFQNMQFITLSTEKRSASETVEIISNNNPYNETQEVTPIILSYVKLTKLHYYANNIY